VCVKDVVILIVLIIYQKNCRKYNICKNCVNEFHHRQNQTCSIKCAKELKEKSFMISCGTKHNFYKDSKSRIDWEDNLLKNEGIVNIFQREDVKKKKLRKQYLKSMVLILYQNQMI
jgi:hypothetical protein